MDFRCRVCGHWPDRCTTNDDVCVCCMLGMQLEPLMAGAHVDVKARLDTAGRKDGEHSQAAKVNDPVTASTLHWCQAISPVCLRIATFVYLMFFNRLPTAELRSSPLFHVFKVQFHLKTFH